MVDLDRIHHRLELLAGYLHELRRLSDLPVTEYLRHECTPRADAQPCAAATFVFRSRG